MQANYDKVFAKVKVTEMQDAPESDDEEEEEELCQGRRRAEPRHAAV